MSPLGLYGAFALILLASAIVGWAVLALTQRREWSWTAPPVGLACLVIVGVSAELWGHAITVSVLFATTVIGAIVVLASRRAGPLPIATVWAPVLALVVIAASVPFAAGGGFDIMGTYVNNDLGFHLHYAEWLRAQEGIEPEPIAEGYPLGPHGLVLAVSTLTGIALPEAWTGLLIAVAAATALASLSVIGRLSFPLRTVGGLLVGMSYLGAAFYVQSAFKETLMALFVLGLALTLREGAGEGPDTAPPPDAGHRWLPAVAPALFVLAAIATYGLPGVAWGVGTAAVWFAIRWGIAGWRERRNTSGKRPVRVGRVAGLAAGAIVVAVPLGYLAWDRSAEFIGGRDVVGSEALANLFDPLPPSQALGLWLSSDYRIVDVSFLGEGGIFTVLLAMLGVVAAGLGVARLVRNRELSLLSALLVAAGAWVVASISLGPYVASKALAIISPLVMLVAIVGIAPVQRAGDLAWIARTLVGVTFVALALGSSYLALAGARLDRDDHAQQLGEFRDEVDGARVLFLGSDELVWWSLRGAEEVVPGTQTAEYEGVPRTGERVDFDSFAAETLDMFDYAISARSGYMSEIPESFHRVAETESFVLYERVGPTPPYQSLAEGDLPGAVLTCDHELRRLGGTAFLWTRKPVVAPFGDEYGFGPTGGSSVEWVNEGQPITRTLDLPAGRWELSLQYHSLEPVNVDVGGLLQAELPPNSSRIGPLWRVGEVELEKRTDVAVTVQPQQRPSPRSLLSFERARTGPETVLGIVAAVPADGRREAVPLSAACGRVVDRLDLDLPG
jgi:hypothetical protein